MTGAIGGPIAGGVFGAFVGAIVGEMVGPTTLANEDLIRQHYENLEQAENILREAQDLN